MVEETVASKQKRGIGTVSRRVRHAQGSSSWDIVNRGGHKVTLFVVSALNFVGGIMIELCKYGMKVSELVNMMWIDRYDKIEEMKE